MDTNDRRIAMNNKRKAVIAPSIPPTPQAVAPVKTEGASALVWFTQATIILALIPFVGYWCAFAFEKGFCFYFDIPEYFISLNPTLVLATSRVLPVLGLVLCFFIGQVVLCGSMIRNLDWSKRETITKPKYTKYQKLLFILAIPAMIGIMLLTLKENPEVISVRNLVFIVSFFVIVAVSVFVYEHHTKGVLWNSILILIITFVLLLGLYEGFDLFYREGKARAEKQDYFPVLREPSSNSEVAVIRNYGDYLYAVLLHRDDKQFEPKLFILKMSELYKTSLTIEKVGPLKPKPIEAKPQQP